MVLSVKPRHCNNFNSSSLFIPDRSGDKPGMTAALTATTNKSHLFAPAKTLFRIKATASDELTSFSRS
jgi:hypothetical protein